MARTPFKLKSSPTKKGMLSNFFSSLGASLNAKKTDMGELRSKQARSSKGVSEFQHNTAKSKATSKANRTASKARNAVNAADAAYYGSPEDKTKNSDTNRIKKIKVKKKSTPPTGKLQSKTRKDEYDAKGWRYDETIKGYNKDGSEIESTDPEKYKTIKGKYGPVSVIDDSFPFPKKSPSKKRGYKMNRKK